MGWMGTAKFVKRHTRTRPHRKIGGGQPHEKWDYIKNILDNLIKFGRIRTTLARCKEFQEYAEELIFLAKKDDLHSQRQVESMLRTARARQILYEELIPRYAERSYHFTRVVNLWYLRTHDSGHMGMLELIDRAGEVRPAKPVGYQKRLYLYSIMKNGTFEEKRKFWNQAVLEGVITAEGKLVKSRAHLAPLNKDYTWRSDYHQVDDALAPPTSTFENQYLSLTDGQASKQLSVKVNNKQEQQPQPGSALVTLEHALSVMEQKSEVQSLETRQQSKPSYSHSILRHPGRGMVIKQNMAFEPFKTVFDTKRKQRRPKLKIVPDTH